jgi:hypothetical protein
LEIDHGAFPGLRTLNEFVCNSLAKFSAVLIRRNLFANVIQSSRHIGNRILIELSKHIALDWLAGDPRQAADPC